MEADQELEEIYRFENPNKLGEAAQRAPDHIPLRETIDIAASNSLDLEAFLAATIDALTSGRCHSIGLANILFYSERPQCRSSHFQVIPADDWRNISYAGAPDKNGFAYRLIEGRKDFYDEWRRIDIAGSKIAFTAFGLNEAEYPTWDRHILEWTDIMLSRKQVYEIVRRINPAIRGKNVPARVKARVSDSEVAKALRKLIDEGASRDEACRRAPLLPGFDGITHERCRQIFRDSGLRRRGRPRSAKGGNPTL